MHHRGVQSREGKFLVFHPVETLTSPDLKHEGHTAKFVIFSMGRKRVPTVAEDLTNILQGTEKKGDLGMLTLPKLAPFTTDSKLKGNFPS